MKDTGSLPSSTTARPLAGPRASRPRQTPRRRAAPTRGNSLPEEPSPRGARSPWLTAGWLLASLALPLAGCSTHHWAQVETASIPPTTEGRQLHSSRVVVEVTDATAETQCIAYERYRPVCFHNIRPELSSALRRQLWPSFPEVVMGSVKDLRAGDYFLQVELVLDALPPDQAGPGWSAGARGRFRLMRDGQILAEETIASRSRAEYPYGAPLGTAASEVVDASVVHIASQVVKVEETRPPEALMLPQVAFRRVDPLAAQEKLAEATAEQTDPRDGSKASPKGGSTKPATATAQATKHKAAKHKAAKAKTAQKTESERTAAKR